MGKLSLLAANGVLYFPSSPKKILSPCLKILRGPETYFKTLNLWPSDGTRMHVLSTLRI